MDENRLQRIKESINRRTGVPASLLTGETAEEVVARAKAVLAYKREHEAQRLEDKDRRTAELLGRHYEAPPSP